MKYVASMYKLCDVYYFNVSLVHLDGVILMNKFSEFYSFSFNCDDACKINFASLHAQVRDEGEGRSFRRT